MTKMQKEVFKKINFESPRQAPEGFFGPAGTPLVVSSKKFFGANGIM